MGAHVPCYPGKPERWFFHIDAVSQTPSIKSGIVYDKELHYRQQAAQFIQDMGQRLNLTQLCMNTAIVFMHRFYMHHSFKQFPRNDLAAASLFLAAKVEEVPKKLENIVRLSYALQHRDEPQLDTKSNLYLDEAQKLVVYENILLQTLGFDLQIEHPHSHVVRCCQLVKAPKDLAQASYFLATDSLHLTTFCLRFRPTVVACVCIYIGCKWQNWEIPESHEGRPWYFYIDQAVTAEVLDELSKEFIAIKEKAPNKLKRKAADTLSHTIPHPPHSLPSSLTSEHHLLESSMVTGESSYKEADSVNAAANKNTPTKTYPGFVPENETARAQGVVSSVPLPAMSPNLKAKLETSSPSVATPPTTASGHNVLDMRKYKERRQQADPVGSATEPGPPRKSFIPDTSKDAWMAEWSNHMRRDKVAHPNQVKEHRHSSSDKHRQSTQPNAKDRQREKEKRATLPLKDGGAKPSLPMTQSGSAPVTSSSSTKVPTGPGVSKAPEKRLATPALVNGDSPARKRPREDVSDGGQAHKRSFCSPPTLPLAPLPPPQPVVAPPLPPGPPTAAPPLPPTLPPCPAQQRATVAREPEEAEEEVEPGEIVDEEDDDSTAKGGMKQDLAWRQDDFDKKQKLFDSRLLHNGPNCTPPTKLGFPLCAEKADVKREPVT